MKKKKINSNNLLLLITIVLFFVMYAAGCIVYADKGFTRFQTFLNILINNAGLICITAGMTCVMLTGGIDISVGSVVAMDCMILAVGIEQWLDQSGADAFHPCNWYRVRCCPGLLYFLSGNSAVYCNYGWYVLCARHDSCDL